MRKKVLVFTLTGGIAAVIVLCTVSSAAVKKGTCAPLPLLKIMSQSQILWDDGLRT